MRQRALNRDALKITPHVVAKQTFSALRAAQEMRNREIDKKVREEDKGRGKIYDKKVAPKPRAQRTVGNETQV